MIESKQSLPILTIYTPTFNRKHYLERVYSSLCGQTCKDFIWLIIDDGSTDDTAQIVMDWKREQCAFEIRYFYQQNGGVHAARNSGLRLCTTELLCSLDSDDWLSDNAVKDILDIWCSYGGCQYAGIISPIADQNGKVIGMPMPNLQYASYQTLFFKYNLSGDKLMVFNTKILSQIPEYPCFGGEKLVPENWKFIQIPDEIPFIVTSRIYYYSEYLAEGLTRNVALNRLNNPNGFRETAREILIHCRYIRPRIKAHIKYDAYSILLHDRNYIKNSPQPIISLLLSPLGFLASLYIKWSAR